MKLLQKEINAIPGARPNRGLRSEGWVGDGATVLDVTNQTSLVNAYTIRVHSEHPYWQAGWYKLTALAPEGDPINQPPKGKPDLPGPKNQTLKIHINSQGTRKVMVEFALPRTSEARAGIYPITIIIESVITDANTAAGPARITEIPAVLIVRSFYDYTIEFQPSDQRVGLFRRAATFELVVKNRSNDWLYLDIKPGRTPKLIPQLAVLKASVPPAEPGSELERSIPIQVASQLRDIRGERIPNTLPLTISRLEAPSVPPLAEDTNIGGAANIGATVLVQETKEVAVAEEAPTLTYCPPIAATFTGFVQAVARNIKGIVLGGVAIFMLFVMGMVVVEREIRKVDFVAVSVAKNDAGKDWVANEGKFTISGTFLDKAQFDLVVGGKDSEPVTIIPDSSEVRLIEKHTIKINQNFYEVTINLKDHPSIRDTTISKILIRRRMFLLGTALMPAKTIEKQILVGGGKSDENTPINALLDTNKPKPGEPVKVSGGPFGKAPGKVIVGGEEVKNVQWANDSLVVPIPTKFEDGTQPFNMMITTADGRQAAVQGIQVDVVSVTVPTEAGAGAGAPGAVPEAGGGAGAPTTGGAPSAGGTTPTAGGAATAAVAPPPAGYTELLNALASGRKADLAEAVTSANGSDLGSKAIRIYALAAAGKVTTAQSEYEAARGEAPSASPRDGALLLAAYARLVEGSDVKAAAKQFNAAKDSADSLSGEPGVALLYMVNVVFLNAHKEWGDPRGLVDKMSSLSGLTESEKKAIRAFKR